MYFVSTHLILLKNTVKPPIFSNVFRFFLEIRNFNLKHRSLEKFPLEFFMQVLTVVAMNTLGSIPSHVYMLLFL